MLYSEFSDGSSTLGYQLKPWTMSSTTCITLKKLINFIYMLITLCFDSLENSNNTEFTAILFALEIMR